MPDTMRCVRIDEWGGEPYLTEAPVPEVGENEVLVEVEATAVGQTVVNAMEGRMRDDPGYLPRIPGHELVGRVTEAGPGVDHLDDGAYVTAFFHLVCDHCEQCQAGRPTLCENHAGHVAVETDGGYAEYARLPAGNAIPIPESIDPVPATAIPDAIATPYHVANQRANVSPGDDVMVLGAGGGVGIHMVQMAEFFGGEATAVDLDDEKLQRCADLGAAHTVNTGERSIVEAAEEFGIEYDAVVDFTGVTELLEDAVDVLGPRGRLVNLTTFGNTFDLMPRKQVSDESAVVGSRYCSKHELRRSAGLVEADIVEPVVSEVVGFEGTADLLRRIADNEVVGRGAMTPT